MSPYINHEKRRILYKKLTELWELPELDAGSKNYVITKFLLTQLPKEPGYADYNELVGVLECCKLEIARRVIYPYENKKCSENGDIFEKD